MKKVFPLFIFVLIVFLGCDFSLLLKKATNGGSLDEKITNIKVFASKSYKKTTYFVHENLIPFMGFSNPPWSGSTSNIHNISSLEGETEAIGGGTRYTTWLLNRERYYLFKNLSENNQKDEYISEEYVKGEEYSYEIDTFSLSTNESYDDYTDFEFNNYNGLITFFHQNYDFRLRIRIHDGGWGDPFFFNYTFDDEYGKKFVHESLNNIVYNKIEITLAPGAQVISNKFFPLALCESYSTVNNVLTIIVKETTDLTNPLSGNVALFEIESADGTTQNYLVTINN